MRKTLTLIICVAGLLGSVWLTLRAAPHDLSVRVVTAPTDVRVRSINGATSVTASDLSATTLTPLTDAGKPSLPMRVVSVLVPRGQSVKAVEAVASHSSPLARKVSLPAYVERPERDRHGLRHALLATTLEGVRQDVQHPGGLEGVRSALPLHLDQQSPACLLGFGEVSRIVQADDFVETGIDRGARDRRGGKARKEGHRKDAVDADLAEPQGVPARRTSKG